MQTPVSLKLCLMQRTGFGCNGPILALPFCLKISSNLNKGNKQAVARTRSCPNSFLIQILLIYMVSASRLILVSFPRISAPPVSAICWQGGSAPMGLDAPGWAQCPPLPLVSAGAGQKPPVPSAIPSLPDFCSSSSTFICLHFVEVPATLCCISWQELTPA